MRGLSPQENERFKRFFAKVQEKAKEHGSAFFIDFGECKDIQFKDMELDDLFGWLIPLDLADEFEFNYWGKVTDEKNEKWDDFMIWCIPTVVENDTLKIRFDDFNGTLFE